MVTLRKGWTWRGLHGMASSSNPNRCEKCDPQRFSSTPEAFCGDSQQTLSPEDRKESRIFTIYLKAFKALNRTVYLIVMVLIRRFGFRSRPKPKPKTEINLGLG